MNQIRLVRAEPRTKLLDGSWQLARTFAIETDNLDTQFFDGFPPVRRVRIDGEDCAANSRPIKVLEICVQQTFSAAGTEGLDDVHYVQLPSLFCRHGCVNRWASVSSTVAALMHLLFDVVTRRVNQCKRRSS